MGPLYQFRDFKFASANCAESLGKSLAVCRQQIDRNVLCTGKCLVTLCCTCQAEQHEGWLDRYRTEGGGSEALGSALRIESRRDHDAAWKTRKRVLQGVNVEHRRGSIVMSGE